jgi:hypothetical protein
MSVGGKKGIYIRYGFGEDRALDVSPIHIEAADKKTTSVSVT